ncbi:MAG: peptidylprolyl isomerase [Bacteroidales bacterium]|nr:peptidylprolyl isomerase [Bacteroidales bacterium]
MKRLFFTFAVLGATLAATAQQDRVLLTIDNKPVMTSEFEYIYQKNNRDMAVEQRTKNDYLEMFINFKLKVVEAETAGLDTTESFKRELQGYRAQAVPKFLEDKQAMDSMVLLSYNRMKYDRRVAHIAVECPMDASDSVQQAAMETITQARNRVKAGADFAQVAVEMSTIPSAKEDKGELGWIIPFRYVYAFENAAYNTPVGEVSEVFRTPYGFHIAKVEEERPHEDVNAAHIMKMVPNGNPAMDSVAKIQIDSIYNALMQGADFAQTAAAQSDDKGSAMRGGDLGWFGRGVMVKPFEDAVFSLGENTISKPFRSRFGWHIAIVKGHRAVLPLDSIRSQVEKNIQRDERHKEIDKSFIAKTRKEYNLADSLTDAEVRDYADKHLEEKYEDFRHLVQEYHDGILLFDISLDKVWDKAAKDEEGLAAYFNAHKADYTWDAPQWKGTIIYAKDMEHAKVARTIVKSANADSVVSYVNTRLNNDSITYVKIETGLWQQGKSEVVDKYGFKLKNAQYTNEQYPVILTVGKKIKAPEEYKDVRAQVTNAYQDELEKQWVEELRQKHVVKVNQEVFDSLPE